MSSCRPKSVGYLREVVLATKWFPEEKSCEETVAWAADEIERLQRTLHDLEAYGGIPEVVQENAATQENNRALTAKIERLERELADRTKKLNDSVGDHHELSCSIASALDWEDNDVPFDEIVRRDRAELKRFRRQYELFEEISPPDVDRKEFVRWCFEAWEKAAEQPKPSE